LIGSRRDRIDQLFDPGRLQEMLSEAFPRLHNG
jgi:hypothetical protein